MAQEQSLIISNDGSHTLYSDKYKAYYHSVYGAIQESIHVFIAAGLLPKLKKNPKTIHIFEMGFGSGLNAYLTLLFAQKYSSSIVYHTIESDPVDLSQVNILNFSDELNIPTDGLKRLHQCEWNTLVRLHENFSIHKIHGSIENFNVFSEYDLIYWDAFAPTCQPFLWEEKIQTKIYNSLKSSGSLVSYCSQGDFRRTLSLLGYSIERLKGPGKKREMIRATKMEWV